VTNQKPLERVTAGLVAAVAFCADGRRIRWKCLLRLPKLTKLRLHPIDRVWLSSWTNRWEYAKNKLPRAGPIWQEV
jgi:hypothetical protein